LKNTTEKFGGKKNYFANERGPLLSTAYKPFWIGHPCLKITENSQAKIAIFF
jgi:hypothetical protein